MIYLYLVIPLALVAGFVTLVYVAIVRGGASERQGVWRG